MEIEKKDIEEVGEAVEALGVMMEKELQKINLSLSQLSKSISEIRSQERTSKEEISELENQIQEIREVLEQCQATVSRTESRISELHRIFQEQENNTAAIKDDLLIIKRDLQFVRSNLKEILDHRENLDKKLKDFENRIDGLEKEKFA